VRAITSGSESVDLTSIGSFDRLVSFSISLVIARSSVLISLVRVKSFALTLAFLDNFCYSE
jgi:hypothetical protein